VKYENFGLKNKLLIAAVGNYDNDFTVYYYSTLFCTDWWSVEYEINIKNLVKYEQLGHYSWLFYMYSSFSNRKINNFTYFLPNRIYYQWDFYLDEKKKWFNIFFDMKSMFNQLFYG